MLVRIIKPGNTPDQYAIAVGKNETVIGHSSWYMQVSCVSRPTLFLKKGGGIHCKVTGQKYSADLHQGSGREELRYRRVTV